MFERQQIPESLELESETCGEKSQVPSAGKKFKQGDL